MQIWVALVGGLIIGWVAEWVIDWLYWRRGVEAFYATEAELASPNRLTGCRKREPAPAACLRDQ